MEDLYCDFCGDAILKGHLKYVVSIEVYAPYEILEVDEEVLEQDFESEIRKCLREMRAANPEDLEADVYKAFRYVICRKCQQRYIRDPIRHGTEDVH